MSYCSITRLFCFSVEFCDRVGFLWSLLANPAQNCYSAVCCRCRVLAIAVLFERTYQKLLLLHNQPCACWPSPCLQSSVLSSLAQRIQPVLCMMLQAAGDRPDARRAGGLPRHQGPTARGNILLLSVGLRLLLTLSRVLGFVCSLSS